MDNQVANSSITILAQIRDIISQLSNEEYAEPLPLLSGNTIGKHCRHVVEFFNLLVEAEKSGVLSYDDRKRDLGLETQTAKTVLNIENIINRLTSIPEDRNMVLKANYNEKDAAATVMNTSLLRELAYNLEHAIHHMAIIKMAILSYFNHIEVPSNFGIAFSTVRYQQ